MKNPESNYGCRLQILLRRDHLELVGLFLRTATLRKQYEMPSLGSCFFSRKLLPDAHYYYQ